MKQNADELVTALAFLILGTLIIVVWTEPVPDWALWSGYLALAIAAGALVLWFVRR